MRMAIDHHVLSKITAWARVPDRALANARAATAVDALRSASSAQEEKRKGKRALVGDRDWDGRVIKGQGRQGQRKEDGPLQRKGQARGQAREPPRWQGLDRIKD